MTRSRTWFSVLSAGLLCTILLAACSPAPATSLEPAVTGAPPTQAPTQVPTLAPTATKTPAPSATPVPTAIPTLGVTEAGFSVWCLPNNASNPGGGYRMPKGGAAGRAVEGGVELDGVVKNCTFIYTFNQPMPEGVEVAIYDRRPDPWIHYALTAAPDDPNTGYFTTAHGFIVNAPFWVITYQFEVRDADGKELRSDDVTILKPQNVGYCFEGELPDPVTLKCRFLGEAHPWDAWYGWDLDPKLP